MLSDDQQREFEPLTGGPWAVDFRCAAEMADRRSEMGDGTVGGGRWTVDSAPSGSAVSQKEAREGTKGFTLGSLVCS